jgi:hypothetical protein
MPEWAGWKRVPGGRDLADTGETGGGVDAARRLVTRCVSFGEAVTPTLALPRYAGEGREDLPPLSVLFADGGGWGGGRPSDR